MRVGCIFGTIAGSMSIDVLQWNVWIDQDIDDVAKVAKSTEADIVCLQELTKGYPEQNRDDTVEYIRRELGFRAACQTMLIHDDFGRWQQANAVFSRFPIIQSRRHWLHEALDHTDQNRGYLEADIWVPDKKLTVATTHASFENCPKGFDHELQKLLDITRDRIRDFVLTGDFNQEPDSERIQALASRFKHAGPDWLEKTWTTKPHDFADSVAATLDWRYDYIFTTPDIEVVKSEMIETDVSDHLPVLARLELSGD